MSGGFRKGSRHRDETRARISRGLQRHYEREAAIQAQQERQVPRLAAFRRRRGLDSLHRRLLDLAATEALEIVEALGGVEVVSPQRLRLIEDAAIAGLILAREFSEYTRTRDAEAATRVTALVNSRRASFSAIGLEAAKADPLNVEAYAEALRAADHEKNPEQDAKAPPVDDRGSCAKGESQ